MKTEALTAKECQQLLSKKQQSGRKQTPEHAVLNDVRDFLRLNGYKVVRIHQSLGSEKGIPDLVAIREGRHVWIECKAPKGYVSDVQQAWLQDLEDHGGSYVVAKSVKDVEQLARR